MRDSGLAEQVAILGDNGLKTQPDLVGIGFYLNDSMTPWHFFVEDDYLYRISQKSRFLAWLYSRYWTEKCVNKFGKHKFNWVKTLKKGKWINNREEFYKMIDAARYDWGAAWQPDSWNIIEKKLDAVLDLGKKHNFKVFLFCFPVRPQVQSEIFENKPQRILQKICYDKEIPYLDLLPVLRDHKDDDLYYDHCHLKPVANQIVADALRRFLEDNHLLGIVTK